jgi:DNA ligase (NAD+)
MEQLLPIKTYVLDPDTGTPKLDEDGKPKVVQFFSKSVKGEIVPAEVAIKLLKNLEDAKTKPLWRFIVALSIRHVGPVAARSLASHFGSLDNIFNATEEELSQVDGVGTILAQSLLEWIKVDWHKDLVESWRKAGVLLEIPGHAGPGAASTAEGVFSGLSIVVTGTLQNYTRESIEELIISNGGKAASSVSKNTAFVVAGANAGSKLAKAESLGVPVISEEEFAQKLI